MIAVVIGFASGGVLLLTMGLFIRKGVTWLIAGYDADQVRDEKGLARWVGSGLMAIGAVGVSAGAFIFVLPEYIVIPVLLYPVAVLGGVITILCGIQRFVK